MWWTNLQQIQAERAQKKKEGKEVQAIKGWKAMQLLLPPLYDKKGPTEDKALKSSIKGF